MWTRAINPNQESSESRLIKAIIIYYSDVLKYVDSFLLQNP